MKININGQEIEVTSETMAKLNEALFGNKVKRLSEIAVGDTFKIGDLEFIVLEQHDGCTSVILKNFWKTAKFDDGTNNFANSKIRKELNTEFYCKVAGIVGRDNILQYNVDLTSDDGRKEYGDDYCSISLLTCDMYRKYVHILDKYRPKDWWLLATTYSTASNGYRYAVRCVNGDGALNYDSCDYSYGVRPFCIFKSSIFVS